MEAQYIIAQMYEDGIGVVQNWDTSWNWYVKAADNGHAEARKIVEKYERKAKKEFKKIFK